MTPNYKLNRFINNYPSLIIKVIGCHAYVSLDLQQIKLICTLKINYIKKIKQL